ncbi:cytochrome c [Sediminicoccus sp. KRV36]|uniref:c-type cytochrome n=1 Tax=Sediminicoccus sp. KRV36 TaxID=3133721 RepID=UPI00200EE2D6|nr:cytochrome c [Sediminicoccus rosea]UPY35574.1 cytochrome c [Sediminicoccus rosea]
MSRSMRRAFLVGVPLLAMAAIAVAQQAAPPNAAPDLMAIYRPFPAPPGPHTRADIAWPAPRLAAGALPAAIPGIGRAATVQEVAGWSIAVRGDGQGLPPGRGTAKDGEELFQQHCASCHGDFGEGLDRWPALMGGRGSLTTDQPRRTVGSYWQHAPSVFDYVRRAMPYAAPQSLTNDDYYALTAYILSINELVAEDAVMDRESLPRVEMPNRNGFVLEARPDTGNDTCMTGCRQGRAVSVTMDSRQFTPPGSGSGTSEPQ